MAEQNNAWSKSFTVKEQGTIIKRLFTYAAPFKWQFLGALIFAMSLAAVNIILPKILQVYMDDYLTPKTATTKIIYYFAVLYLIGVLVKALVSFFENYLYAQASLKTFQYIRVQLYEKLHTLGMRYFDQTPAGSIVSRLTNDTETLFEFWNVFLSVLTAIFAVVSAFIAMFAISPKLSLICMCLLPFLFLAIWGYQKFSSQIYRHMREKLSQLNTKLNESLSGIRIVQQFRQESRLEKEFKEVNDQYYSARVAVVKTNSLLLGPIINLLVSIATILVLLYFGVISFDSPVEAGVIYAFISYVQALFNPMGNMMDFLSGFQDGLVAASRIFKIMDHQEETPAQTPVAGTAIREGKIEFRNVTFAYDGENPVLRNISFVAEPGHTVALVGHTGSGKSSIINVLMRFYEYGEGQILLDDVDIRSYEMPELRRKMGLVLQDSFMFYGDIAGNIRLMNPEISEEEVRWAAEFVQADAFIQELPGGYHAKVIERGASYSSGQRQLLSFARTMVTHPKILILDEATANIDTETERLIQGSLAKMREGRTTIAIAHRLSTIMDADTILVLDHGAIVERGNHEELIAQEGLYYDMYRLQNSRQELNA